LTAASTSASRIGLSWTAPGDEDLEDFVVYQASAAAGPFSEIGTTSSTSLGATGLAACTRYWFQVRARDGAGQLSEPSAAATDSTPAAAAFTVTVIKGTLVSGGSTDLQGSDDVDVAVQATGYKKKWTAEFSVSGSIGTLGGDPLQVDYEIGAGRPATLVVSLWRWQTRRWQNAGEAKIGPTDVARSILIRENAARFVSGTGEVRVRFLVKGSASLQTFVTGLDALAMGSGVDPEAEAEDQEGGAPGALPADEDPAAGEAPAAVQILVLPGPQGTGVRFAVRGAVQDGVRLFDVRGREVVHLQHFVTDGARRVFAWTGRDATGRPVARGVYFARSRVAEGTLVRRLVWLRE
jgi:chitodextrinase